MAGIKSFFKDMGIQKAAENGYIQEVSGDIVKDNGVSVKVDDVVADEGKVAVSFTFKFDDINKLKNIKGMDLGLNIKDNNERVIFENLQEGIYSPNYISSESNIDTQNVDNGEIKYYFKIYDTEGQLKDINNLSIKIDEVKLYEEDVRNKKVINDEWNLSLDLDEKFANETGVRYKAINNNDILNVRSAQVNPTGMLIKFNINSNVNENIVNKVSVIDKNGDEFSNMNSARMNTTSNGAELSMMFDITKFDDLDSFKLVVKYINGENISIDLVRE